MANLNQTIQSLAVQFATDLVVALRGVSLEEILGAGGSKRPAATSKASTSKSAPRSSTSGKSSAISVDAIVAVLKQHKEGLRSEHLRKAVGASLGTWRYQMKKARESKRVSMRGTKNSAVYFAS